MSNTWIITSEPSVAHLVDLGTSLGGQIIAVVVGDAQVTGVDRLIRIAVPEGVPVEAMAPAISNVLTPSGRDVVLVPNNSTDRVLAGSLAASLNLPIVLGLTDVGEGQAQLSRYGGIAAETVSFDSPIVGVVEGGGICEADDAPPEESAEGNPYDVHIEEESIFEGSRSDISSAERLVVVGRGFKEQEDVKLAEQLAGSLNAEVACSRPLAEGAGWMHRDQYVGISGLHVAPELYVAVGVSGQIQHTAGMHDSRTVVAINNDPAAPIFDEADYGLVADLYEALPALIEELK